MRRSILFVFIAMLFVVAKAQNNKTDSLRGFDDAHFLEHINKFSATERNVYLEKAKRNFIKSKYYPPAEKTFPLSAFSSTCANMDFEDGNTGGWTLTGDFQLMTGTGTDPYGGFPVVCPGGSFSLRLNDDNVNATTCSPPGTKSTFTSTASHNITISSANSIVKVNFAACFLQFPHSQSDASRIRIEFYDLSNNLLSVPVYTVLYSSPPGSVIATSASTSSVSTIQGPQVCNYGTYPVVFLPWQQQVFNLSSYTGQTIKIKLSASWCLYQYDWGYGYFDVCCDNSCPYIGDPSVTYINNNCTTTPFSSVACTGYPGNVNYNWVGAAGPLGTSTCISVNSTGGYTLSSNPPSTPGFTVFEIFNYGTTPSITFTLPPTTCYSSSSSGVAMFASPSGGTFSGASVSGSTFYPTSIGVHTVSYTYTDPVGGCTATASQTTNVVVCTEIINIISNEELIIAPNPFDDRIIISGKRIPEATEFILFNTLGQEILRKRLNGERNMIRTDELLPGIYLYNLFIGDKPVKQGKLIKE